MSEIQIVPFRKGQEPEIEEICYQTGFYGKTLSGTDRFLDKKLFALCFCLYYPLYEPQNCFVALDGEKVVGYIVGTDDSARQKQLYDKRIVPRIVLRALFHTLFTHPNSFLTLLHMNRYGKDHDESSFFAIYPAHFHINLHPLYQGRGIGSKLIERFEQHMVSRGVKGIHLSTSDRNEKGVPFYLKKGYSIIRKTPGQLWPGVEESLSLVMGKIL